MHVSVRHAESLHDHPDPGHVEELPKRNREIPGRLKDTVVEGRGHVEHRIVVLLGHEQDVPRPDRLDIEEREKVTVLPNVVAGDPARDDLTEHAEWRGFVLGPARHHVPVGPGITSHRSR
jgi:hypothetical protein